jgi:predicted O-methyltransferase YrrM
MPDDFLVVVAENRRLLEEVRELRARVAAVDASRWWRLHPRLVLRRLRGRFARPGAVDDAAPVPVADPDAAANDPLTLRFRAEVVERGSFRSDDFTGNIPLLEPLFRELAGTASRVLEIGSFEGLSTCYLLWRLPDAAVTCIDTFTGGSSFAARGADVSGLEATFDRNVALVDGARIRKLVGDSAHFLLDLVAEGERYDLVYVDGSDLALDVMVDGCLSWQLLVPGGFMIFDNYGWRSPLGEDPLFQPKAAVDAFIELVGHQCESVTIRNQAVLRRRR